MTDVIPFPPRDGDQANDPASTDARPSRRGSSDAIPHDLIEAAADILNDILANRRGQSLTQEDWSRIMRAVNFIDGANTVAREQGLPHGRKPR